MKYIKRFFVFVLVIIILLAGSVFVLITFYKKDLTALLIEELKTNYGLNLQVDEIKVSFIDNWPHASIELQDVILESRLNEGKSEPLVKAGSIALSFNLERMMHQEFILKYVTIKNAEINLIKNEDGTKNFVFKKESKPDTTIRIKNIPAPTNTTAINFELSKITIKNSQFNYINRQREQKIQIKIVDNDIRLKQYSDGMRGRLQGEVLIGGLLFNAKKGAFLANTPADLDLHVTFFNENKVLAVFPPSTIEIADQKYNVATLINLGKDQRLALMVETKNILLETATTLLTPKMKRSLDNFAVKNPVNAKMLLVVNIGKREDPALILNFDGKNNSLLIGTSSIPYSDIDFRGKLISLDTSGKKGDIENAKLIFYPVKGKVYDFPFTGSVKVTNLIDPVIAIKARVVLEGSKVKFKVAKDFVLKGTTIAQINYSGPTEKLNSHEFLEKPMKLNANLTFKDMSYKEVNRPYTYVINGKANLNNRDLKFEDLHLNTIVGEAILKGKAENFINYVLGYSDGFKAILAARTELLDLNPLLIQNKENQELLKNSEKDEIKKEKQEEKKLKRKGLTKKKKKKKAVIDEPVIVSQSRFEFNVQLFAKKMLIRNVEAQFANADLYYKNDFLNIKSINLNTCEGKLFAKGTIRDFSKIKADVTIHNVNVNKLFTQFENFGQEAIVSENLKGNLSLEAKIRTDLDSKMEVIGESMSGEVKLKLRDGHLLNFEPVQNLSNILFKNRNFNDVSFSELSETFRIQGYRLDIEELEIASNVLNLYVVNGHYNIKGNSNFNILIPWSNLKKRGKNYIPKSSGESAQNTKGVKLNFQGPNKQMKLTFGHKEFD